MRSGRPVLRPPRRTRLPRRVADGARARIGWRAGMSRGQAAQHRTATKTSTWTGRRPNRGGRPGCPGVVVDRPKAESGWPAGMSGGCRRPADGRIRVAGRDVPGLLSTGRRPNQGGRPGCPGVVVDRPKAESGWPAGMSRGCCRPAEGRIRVAGRDVPGRSPFHRAAPCQ